MMYEVTTKGKRMDATGYRILILDDEDVLGEVLSQALKNSGFRTKAVTTVDDAISAVDQESFDAILSDIYLPEKSGFDLFEHARQNHPDLPFVFITGNPSLDMAIDSLKQGAYDFLAKPIQIKELVSKMHEVLEKSRQNRLERVSLNEMRAVLNKRMEELRIYQDIFQSKKDGLLIIATDGTVVKVNPGFARMSGVAESDFAAQNLDFLFEKLNLSVSFSEVRDSIKKNGEWRDEIICTRPDGAIWHANIAFYPVMDETGQTFSYSGIFTDVTSIRSVEQALISSLQRTTKAQQAIIFGLARLAEYRDQDTGYHLERIRSYCRELGLAMMIHPAYSDTVDEKFIDLLYRTAPLHDIGKVGIPDNILMKKGRLTPGEFDIMKSHTLIGYHTLSSIKEQYGEMEFLNMGIEITHAHHERFDGRGYPRGLKKDEIPLSAQIVAVADVYDALTSRRIYKKAFSHEVSLNTMRLERGQHFDPQLFDLFLAVADRFDKIRQRFMGQGLHYTANPQ